MYIRDGKIVELIHNFEETTWLEISLIGDVLRFTQDDATQIAIYKQEKWDFVKSLDSEVPPPIFLEWLKQISPLWLEYYYGKNYYIGFQIHREAGSTAMFWPSFYSGGAMMHYAYKYGYISNNYSEGYRIIFPKEVRPND